MKPQQTLSPMQLEILLHYTYSPDQYPWLDGRPAESRSRILAPLMNAKMLEYAATDPAGDRSLKITEGGLIFIRHILSTPFPKQVWVIPERDK